MVARAAFLVALYGALACRWVTGLGLLLGTTERVRGATNTRLTHMFAGTTTIGRAGGAVLAHVDLTLVVAANVESIVVDA